MWSSLCESPARSAGSMRSTRVISVSSAGNGAAVDARATHQACRRNFGACGIDARQRPKLECAAVCDQNVVASGLVVGSFEDVQRDMCGTTLPNEGRPLEKVVGERQHASAIAV